MNSSAQTMRYDLQVSQRPMCPRFVEAANRTEGTGTVLTYILRKVPAAVPGWRSNSDHSDRSTLSCMRRPKLLSQLDSARPLLGVLVVVLLSDLLNIRIRILLSFFAPLVNCYTDLNESLPDSENAIDQSKTRPKSSPLLVWSRVTDCPHAAWSAMFDPCQAAGPSDTF